MLLVSPSLRPFNRSCPCIFAARSRLLPTLSLLSSAFTVDLPVTPLSSAFAEYRGYTHLSLSCLPKPLTFQRSTFKTSRQLVFSITSALFLPSPSYFQQLTHSLHRKIGPKPSKIKHRRTLSQKTGVYGVPPGMVYLCLPLPACKPSNALVASRVPLRDLQTLPTPVQIAAMACNTLSKPCFSVQEHASPGCRSEKHCRRTARHATMNFRRNCFADDSFV